MRAVKILKTDERLGIVAGEVYNAERYRIDPEKITLLSRVPDGYDPCCNQYADSVAHMLLGKWHIVVNGVYVPEEEK